MLLGNWLRDVLDPKNQGRAERRGMHMEPNAAKPKSDVLLDVKDLNIRSNEKGYVNAVEHLDFQDEKGELLPLWARAAAAKASPALR